MAGTPVLGSVALQDFEVPERIGVGGRQQLVVHNLPGGGRVIDAMGPDEAEIKWSGFFSGQDAAERVRTLEQLRRAGNSLGLAWDSWRYTVIIREFTADVSNPCWIPYRIQLCVVPDPGAGSDDRSDLGANCGRSRCAGLWPEHRHSKLRRRARS